jgi:long-chain acyl-CoA synthetase
MEVTRLFDLLQYHKQQFPNKQSTLAGKEDGSWKEYSIDEFINYADNISYGLLKLGISKGDKIATISNNRPEWNFLDMGILQIGAIHVPIYPTISESDYKYILNHSEVKYVFVAGKELLTKIDHILPEIPNIKGVYTFKHIDKVPHLSELIDLGKKNSKPEKLEEIKNSVDKDDTATLIYTSGTTGDPKGVMLSHTNIVQNLLGVKDICYVDETYKMVSYLPLCHVYERTNIYWFIYKGTTIYYAENMGTIVDNIREIKPQVLTTVPRLLEKVYDKILERGSKLKGIKKFFFNWALAIGKKYKTSGNGPFYKIQHKIVDKLVFSKWRDALGGEMRIIISGGAALSPQLSKIFHAAGLPILEGYGLTETSPVIAVNTIHPGGNAIGTVGKPLFNMEVRIAEDGEILCKGPCVMKGYYKQPDLTAEAIDKEGWFHTGDIGELLPEGHLKITGRKKEIFKTSLGKYISPQLLENKFKESPFIDGIVVLGEHQKFAAALIVPDFNYLTGWCASKGINYDDLGELIKNAEVLKQFKKEINHYNRFFGKTEQIQRFELLDHEFSIETGELTANLKLKRRFITERYKDKIENLFK